MRRRFSLSAVMFIFCLLFVVRGGAFCAESESGQHTETEKQGVFVLGEIEVIGKAEETENAAVSSVFDEEMKLFTRDDIADAANLLPGVTLSYAGARNEQTLHVRGFDIKHVPIFLDGIPIYVPYDGYPDLGRFITFDLSELLISKGFTSVLYGPNTMGGALNMVSKRPDKLFETNGGAGISSGDTYQVYGNFGTNQNKYYVQGGASYIDSRYFRLSDDFSPVKTEDGGKRENSYTRDKKVNFKIAYTPSDGNEYAFSYINQQGKKGTPVYAGTDTSVTARYWQWPYWDKESYYVTSRTALGTESYFKTRLFYDNFENSLYSFDDDTYSTISKKYAFRSAYDDYSAGGSLEGGTDLFARNMIKVAVHFKKDVHREDNEGHPIQTFKDEIFSLGIEDTIDLSTDFYVIAGADYDFLKSLEAHDLDDDNQLTDFPTDETDAFNPQIGFFYKLSPTGTAHVSVAGKTRLPSIKDRYSYRLGTALPNPGLEPEKAINYEAGYKELFWGRLRLETCVFYSDISDFILFATVPDPENPEKTLNQNHNIGKVEQYGAEFDISASVTEKLECGFNYTYLQRNNRSTSDKLTDTPDHKFFAYVKYFPISRLSFLLGAEHESERYTSTDGKRIADAFTTVSLKAMCDIFDGIKLEGGVNNIFDEDYAYQEGYPEPGRNYFANLTYRF